MESSRIDNGARGHQVKTPDLDYTPGGFPVSPVASLSPGLHSSHNSVDSPIDPDSFYRTFESAPLASSTQQSAPFARPFSPATAYTTTSQPQAVRTSNIPSSLPRPTATSSTPYSSLRANLKPATGPATRLPQGSGDLKLRSVSSTRASDNRAASNSSVVDRARQFEQGPSVSAARLSRKSLPSYSVGAEDASAAAASAGQQGPRYENERATTQSSVSQRRTSNTIPTAARKMPARSPPADSTHADSSHLPPPRQPLFGEVITVTNGEVGHGIPNNYAKKSASESNMKSPSASPMSTRGRSRLDTQLERANAASSRRAMAHHSRSTSEGGESPVVERPREQSDYNRPSSTFQLQPVTFGQPSRPQPTRQSTKPRRYSASTEHLSSVSGRDALQSSASRPTTPQSTAASKRYVRTPDRPSPSGHSVNAVIKALPPKTAPAPSLRSSRPRLPLSAASTTSSRAKQSERSSSKSSRNSSPVRAPKAASTSRERKPRSAGMLRAAEEVRQKSRSRNRRPNYAPTDSESSQELRRDDTARNESSRGAFADAGLRVDTTHAKPVESEIDSALTDMEVDESPILGRTVYQPIGQRHDRTDNADAVPVMSSNAMPSRLSPIEASPDPNELANADLDVTPGAERPPMTYEPPRELLEAVSSGGDDEGTIRVQLRGTPVIDAGNWQSATSAGAALPADSTMRDSGIGGSDVDQQISNTPPTRQPYVVPKPSTKYQPYDTPPEGEDFQPGSARIIVGPEVPPKHSPRSPQLPQIPGVGTGLGLLEPLTPRLPTHPPPPVPAPSSASLRNPGSRAHRNRSARIMDSESEASTSGASKAGEAALSPRASVTPDPPAALADKNQSIVSQESPVELPDSTASPRTSDAVSPVQPELAFTSSQSTPKASVPPVAQKLIRAVNISPTTNTTTDQRQSLNAEDAAQQIKRTNKVRHIVAELITTEEQWRNDLDMVDVLYISTAKASEFVNDGDIQIIFGNWQQLLETAQKFKVPLHHATKSIYYKKSSETETFPKNWDNEDVNVRASREVMLSVGAVFLEWAVQLAQVFGKYIYNQAASAKRLEIMKEDPHFKYWLDCCVESHKDIPGAWDLSAFLVKPLQRLTKYPLLLKSLLEEIRADHPDRQNISEAITKLNDEISQINVRKARLDLIEKVKSGEMYIPKKLDEKKHLTSAFSRMPGFKLFKPDKKKEKKKKTDKELARDLRIMAKAEDPVYQKYSQRFGAHFFQIQIVVADIAQYTQDVRACSQWFMDLAKDLMALVESSQVRDHQELVSRWVALSHTAQDFATHGIEHHAAEINQKIVAPLKHLWAYHVSPHKLMGQRKKHLAIYVRYLEFQEDMRDDPRLIMPAELEAGKQRFEALNETLKEDLPRLYEKTDTLVKALGTNFMVQSAEWHKTWVEKFAPLLELGPQVNVENILPSLDINGILMSFRNDFGPTYAEAQELSICNGSLKQNIANALSPGLDGATSPSARPSTQTSRSETYVSSPSASRRHSGQHSLASPPPASYPTPAEQYAAAPGRTRGNSYGTSLSPAGPSNSTAAAGTTSAAQSRPTSEEYRTQARRLFNSAVPMGPEFLSSGPGGEEAEDDDDEDDEEVMFIAASLFDFHIDPVRVEGGYPYLSYQPGEIFNVYGVKGEVWLASNQDDAEAKVGWIWDKHFARISHAVPVA